MTINLTDGTSYVGELQVWNDHSVESWPAYRLVWSNPETGCGCPAVGYCSPGGTHRTIRAAIADGVKRFGIIAKRVR